MKPEFRPGSRREERRQAGERGIHQHGHAPLGQRADLAQGHGDHVGGEGHRLGMEIAARQRRVASAKISGLSETLLASSPRVAAAWRSRSRQAPITCGWQRRQ